MIISIHQAVRCRKAFQGTLLPSRPVSSHCRTRYFVETEPIFLPLFDGLAGSCHRPGEQHKTLGCMQPVGVPLSEVLSSSHVSSCWLTTTSSLPLHPVSMG